MTHEIYIYIYMLHKNWMSIYCHMPALRPQGDKPQCDIFKNFLPNCWLYIIPLSLGNTLRWHVQVIFIKFFIYMYTENILSVSVLAYDTIKTLRGQRSNGIFFKI